MITVKPWQQGRLILTPMIKSMNKEAQEEFAYREKCQIYEDFCYHDRGKTRVFVAQCKDPETADDIASEVMDLPWVKALVKDNSEEQIDAMCYRHGDIQNLVTAVLKRRGTENV